MCYNNTVSKSEHNKRVELAGKIVTLSKELYDIQLDLDIESENSKINEIEQSIAELKHLRLLRESSIDNEDNIERLEQELKRYSSAKYISYLINVEGLTEELAIKKQLDMIASIEIKLNKLNKERNGEQNNGD